MRLRRDFFARETLVVARELLGQRLVRLLNGRRIAGRVVEVEAYIGQDDEACHARSGWTERNASMFGPPGHAYVYFVYGMHHLLNAVTEREGVPAAVLIRALEPLEGVEMMRQRRDGRPDVQLTSGRGGWWQAVESEGRLDGADFCAADASLFFERDKAPSEQMIETGPRIGIRGDEAALQRAWRFYIKRNRYVS